ncbi:cytochrome P450 [Mycolicibacterium rhodesiae]|uniref:Steroid C26-monooxygenase n=1 Tax=Mycolicibacterium rhodesiae TaxID=36814 RepID=A0A1X0IXY7_MYCRH|nr:cytochrome P450 [Mycolicibacterium rhodesiae]MCV7346772.1 cytochrome P450 [Mycolicibacterium rhodesiae]ORB53976.1 cytochrome [Mycolicibacterium rhodesiae]
MSVQSPDIVLDPYNYDFHEDPYPYYKRLRDEAPLYYNEDLKFWALSRHADVLQGFRNSTTLSNKYGVSLDPASRGPHASKTMSFLAMDDPAHLRLRTLVSKGFTPRRIRELEPRVTEIATKHLDVLMEKAAAGGTVDYVDEFAGKLPMDVISELMGVPEADRVQVRAWADGVMHREEGVTDVPPEAVEASLNLIVYYQAMVEERRKNPSDDLTSALLDAEIDGDRLTDDEVLGFMFLMVIAGNETTTKLLANAAFWGHKNPDQLAEVYTDLSRVPLWVEETLRYDTSSQILARTVAGELTLYDTVIPDGDVVLLLPGSAHRDERAFERPDDYLIGRDIGAKLQSFGSGAHFCLGAHLARMEARVALEELFKRIRGYEVDEANSVRVHSSNVRGFAHLPITVQAR